MKEKVVYFNFSTPRGFIIAPEDYINSSNILKNKECHMKIGLFELVSFDPIENYSQIEIDKKNLNCNIINFSRKSKGAIISILKNKNNEIVAFSSAIASHEDKYDKHYGRNKALGRLTSLINSLCNECKKHTEECYNSKILEIAKDPKKSYEFAKSALNINP